MTRATAWASLATRLGIRPHRPAEKSDAGRRVDRVLPRLSGTAPDVEIALALLAAASSGELRKRLAETHTRSVHSRSALRAEAKAERSAPVLSRGVIVASVVGVIAIAAGPILAYPSVRTMQDYIVVDLQTAALSSGIVMLVTALWFAVTEVVRNSWSGSRRGGWGYPFYFVPIVASAAGISSILKRIGAEGAPGAVGIGLALQFVALALYVVALFAAIRNRKEADALAAAAALNAPVRNLNRVNARVQREMSAALSKAPAAELDRDAAIDGLRKLFEQGKIPADRAENILRGIGAHDS